MNCAQSTIGSLQLHVNCIRILNLVAVVAAIGAVQDTLLWRCTVAHKLLYVSNLTIAFAVV
jgi:hypothetical protein